MNWVDTISSDGLDSGAGPSSDSLWVIEINGMQEGPVKWSVIGELARVGALKLTDSISPYEVVCWRKVGDCPTLAVLVGPTAEEICNSALVQKAESEQRTINSGPPHGWLSRTRTLVLLWLCLGFAWVPMMLSDWPVFSDGALIARFSVFGGLALGAISVFVLPRFWQAHSSNLSWPTQALRVFCAGAVFVIFTLLLALGINGRDVVKIAFGVDEFRGGSVAPVSMRMIEVRGPLSAGIAKKVKVQLELLPETESLLLNSEGGWVREGERIGRLISQRGLNTHSDIECSSACAAAFVHGQRRTLSPDAYLGFHSASGDGTDPFYIQMTNEWLAQRLAEIGVSSAFIERAFSTSSTEMWYPSHSELVLEGIIHDINRPAELGEGNLHPVQ